MKKYLLLSVLGLLCFAIAEAAMPFAVNPQPNNIKNFNQNTSPIEYKVQMPEKYTVNGGYVAAQTIEIRRVAPEFIVSKTLHVKTKQSMKINKDKKGFANNSLQSAFFDYGIEKISAPFENKNETEESNDAFGIGRIYEVHYSSDVDPYQMAKELMQNPEIEYACPVYVRKMHDFTPNDPKYSPAAQYALKVMQCAKAWDVTSGDKSVVVAIIDGGTFTDHQDLKAAIWTNPGEIPNNGIDDDKNGKIDDVNGWDFVGNVSGNEVSAGTYKEDNDPKPTTASLEHGTHTAGCACAVTNNSIGIASPGFSCSILPVKCASEQLISSIFRGYEGILYAAKLKADIINCSWGGAGSSPAEQDLIHQVVAMGSVIVVSAGNDSDEIDSYNTFPACYDGVLCVGASTSSDKVASFSNWGYKCDVYAPGQGILSTLPNNNYGNMDGTSMSSPVAAGVAALVKCVHKTWTPKQIIHQLRSTVDNVLVSNQDQRPLFFGRVNAYKAVSYNNPMFPNNVCPGIEIIKTDMDGGATLTDYQTHRNILTFNNYLGTATNLKMTIIPIDSFFSVTPSALAAGTLMSDGQKEMNIYITLKQQSNPWYKGWGNILIKYEADGGYVDYQMLQIPISVTSNNVLTTVSNIPQTYTVQWLGAHAYNYSNFAAIGAMQYIGPVLYTNTANPVKQTNTDQLYCIYAQNAQTMFGGSGPSNGKAKIFKTVNAGSSWSGSDVSGITNFVNTIYFADANNGFFFGDPVNNKWGIGKTTNGGTSWSAVSMAISPDPNETGYAGCGCWRGTNGYFGTSAGNIYFTTNSGANWKVSNIKASNIITHVSMFDDMNGIAIYTASMQVKNSPRYIASTTDAGNNWQTGLDFFAKNGLYPVMLSPLDSSGMIVALCRGGEVYGTKDVGLTWIPILSRRSNGADVGSLVFSGLNTQIWNASAPSVEYLQFNAAPKNQYKAIKINQTDTIKFGDVMLTVKKSFDLSYQNTGNVDLNIDQFEIKPVTALDSEFFFFQPPATLLAAGESKSVRLRFGPKTVGEKIAKLTIHCDASSPGNQTTELFLKGNATKFVGVEDPESAKNIINVYPNPSSEKAYILMKLNDDLPANIELYDVTGTLLNSIFNGILYQTNAEIELNCKDYPNGVYFLKINIDGKIYIKNMIISN
ncbi:MAG: S8 family serine peptidase [Candidatus Kapabacteria bacterium]|nr:S8 family serine peptidase [Candidatus Kapabacteria bacterium]